MDKDLAIKKPEFKKKSASNVEVLELESQLCRLITAACYCEGPFGSVGRVPVMGFLPPAWDTWVVLALLWLSAKRGGTSLPLE